MLERELETYQRVRDQLPIGQVVLIHGDELAGVFGTTTEALAEGARRFGRGPFLVRPVSSEEPIVSNPALSLGILRALPPS